MQTVYRLNSGKIFRVENGENKCYKAPCEFVPTPTELAANRFRLEPVRVLPDGSNSTVAVPEILDVSRMELPDALAAIAIVSTGDALDGLSLQEADRKPSARKKVLQAIEARRDELKAVAVSS